MAMSWRTWKLVIGITVFFVFGLLLHKAQATAEMGISAGTRIAQDFINPPDSARVWTYWWWLNGCVTRDGLVRDLDQMKSRGIGGALVFHAGAGKTPFAIEFMSPQWRELFKFAVQEAAKRNIVIGLNICGGWNAGGPWVKPEEAAQTLGFQTAMTHGSGRVTLALAAPRPAATQYYRDVAVLAWQCTVPAQGQPAVCRHDSMLDLTAQLQGDQLTWDAPAGNWVVVRFGHYVHPGAQTKFTGGQSYLEIDPLRADTMDRHFAATAGVLASDVNEYVGKTFQYVHIDSGEIGKPDWTPAFREEFKTRRGYDPFPYLAARAAMPVDSTELTERFNEDVERTLGELMVQNYYGRLTELAHRQGLGAHSEAAGFQKPCVDALSSLGANDICMSEFWTRRSEGSDPYIHQLAPAQLSIHDGIRTAAAAAHTYGHPLVQAEAWTVMRDPNGFPNYDKDPYALKDMGDRAFCAGLNRAMLCFMVSQPNEHERPGYDWPRVGTEFSRHITWWPLGGAWLTYLARCQSLLQAGQFVADACYFPGEWVPCYVPAKWALNPALPAGYDCDTVNGEVLLQRLGAGADGRVTLPGGMSYRYLVLSQAGRWPPPESARSRTAGRSLAMSPQVLAKIKSLVEGGITLIGPPPARGIGLTNYPRSDKEVARLAALIWGPKPAATGERKVGQGRVIWGKSLEEFFAAAGLQPDLAIREDASSVALTTATLNGIPNPAGSFDWIHRRLAGAEVYFIANLRSVAAGGEFTFRVAGRRPELWDPVTGRIRFLPEYRESEGRTALSLHFEPRQSFFVLFRPAEKQNSEGRKQGVGGRKNSPQLSPVTAIQGAWDVVFDPQWGGPAAIRFEELYDWTRCELEGIRHYSGTAKYTKTFDLPPAALRKPHGALYLDLGVVKNMARVRLNGQDLGVVWTAPWRVEISDMVRVKDNRLEIEVVNLWPNRLIGDAALSPEKRRTTTNIPDIKPDWPLYPAGLLGPVTLQMEQYSMAE